MSEKIIHQPRNLKAGLEIPFLVEKIKMTAGTYVEGEIIQYDPDIKKGAKCTDTTKLYGVATDKFTVAEDGEITVYICGIFNSQAIKKESSVEMDTLKLAARPFNLYFR